MNIFKKYLFILLTYFIFGTSLFWAHFINQAVGLPDFRYTNALTISISEQYYKTPSFVGLSPIYQFLVENDLLANVHHQKNAKNDISVLMNREYINAIIEKSKDISILQNETYVKEAIERDYKRDVDTEPPSIIKIHQHEDKGIITWFKIGLFLFDYDIYGIFYLYVIILITSYLVYIMQFEDFKYPIYVALIFSIIHFIDVASLSNYSTERGPIINVRFLSLLAFLPSLHVFFAILYNVKYDIKSCTLLLIQVVLLAFLFHVRSTVIIFYFIIFFCAFYQFFISKNLGNNFFDYLKYYWVTSITVISLFSIIIVTPILQPKSFEKNTNYHLTWHNILIGFSVSPYFFNDPRYSFLKIGGDAIGFEAVKESDYSTASQKNGFYHHNYDHKGYEKVVKNIVFDMVKDNPYQFVILEIFYKPRELLNQFLDYLNIAIFPLFKGSIGFFILSLFLFSFYCFRKVVFNYGVLVYSVLGFLLSAMPFLVAYPAPFLLTDLFTFFAMFFFLAIGLLINRIFLIK